MFSICRRLLCRMGRKRILTMGKGAASCLSKYIQPSLWVRNHHLKIQKGLRLERMTILQRELKKIRGSKEVMASHHCDGKSQLPGLWMMLIRLGCVLLKSTSRSFLRVIQATFTSMVKAIMYLRRQQYKMKRCLLPSSSNFSNVLAQFMMLMMLHLQLDLLLLMMTMPQHLKMLFIPMK